MIPAVKNPDLRRIGEDAFREVLRTFLSWPAAVRGAPEQGVVVTIPDPVGACVSLIGQSWSGTIHVQLPRAFVIRVVETLAGRDACGDDLDALLDDAAGEIDNMVAGRVAGGLAAEGHPCTLGTPVMFRGGNGPGDDLSETDCRRVELVCQGQVLLMELRCRFSRS